MDLWYCHINGQQYGPVAEQELSDWVRETRLAGEDLVWRNGWDNWRPARQVWPGWFGLPHQTWQAAPRAYQPSGYQPGYTPHRGGLVLALGLVGILTALACVGLPLGIASWSMGSRDLDLMSQGHMDSTGEGLTRAGRIMGIIATILGGLILLVQMIAILS